MKIVKLLGWMALIVLIPMTASQASVNDFAGLWRNIDSGTRGITKLTIATAGTGAKLRTWGACHPQACDWGTVDARYAPANMLKAYYKNSFSERLLVLTKTSSAGLKVEMRTHYTDHSGRPDATAIYQFRRMSASGVQPAVPNAKPNVSHQARPKKSTGIAGKLKAASKPKKTAGIAGPGQPAIESRPSQLQVIFPKGGEELVAGNDITIQWKSAKKKKSVSLILLVENLFAQTKIPTIITKNAPNTGRYQYRLPFKWNSRLGLRFRLVIQEGGIKAVSPLFNVYPPIDLVVQNPKVRSKKKGKRWLKWAVAAATGSPAVAAVRIKPKSHIEVEFDLKNMGIEIIKSKFMSKVTVRLNPGNAELNSAGFSHQNIVPGRNYHYKAKINPKDWNMTPGSYRLEIWADPQNNAHEHEKLRANNRVVIPFSIK